MVVLDNARLPKPTGDYHVKMTKTVLITGGSRGIGRAICRSFAEAGYVVIINYNRSEKEAAGLKDDLQAMAPDVVTERADVSDYNEVKAMVERVVERFGSIDVLVNNAGIVRDSFLMLMSERDWDDVISINLTGVFNAAKAVTPHMISQRSGVIINVSSLSGTSGLPGQTNYAASKGGVIAFTRALSRELAHFGIRVNAVAPGVIETDIIESLEKEKRDEFLRNIPLKRFGRPEEVASVVRFLASEDATYITGEVIYVTGGLY